VKKRMNLRQRIKVILNETLGVPDDINMIVNIYTDLIIDTIKNDIDNVDSEEVQINVEKYEDEEAFKYDFKISPKESWEYLKNSPQFNIEEWKKFPTFINRISFSLITFPDGMFEDQGVTSPQIEASHVFAPSKFELKQVKKWGEVYAISSYDFSINMKESELNDIEKIRTKLKSVIAHEIFHSYQLYKKYKGTSKVGFGKEAVMNSFQQILQSQWNPEWNSFMRGIYYALRFEQQARTPQLYYELKDKGIKSYEDFMRELAKTEYFNEINFLRNFSTQKMIDSITKIESFEDLILRGPKSQEFEQNIENWNDYLQIVASKLRSNGVDIDNFRGIGSKVRQDPKTFFEYWEKFFDNRAEEMFRRATRLYDKLKQD
jgi:predicted SprT family Zn-dependent metalloprotease